MSALVNGDRKVPWATELATTAPLAPLKYEVAINARALPETTDSERPLRYIDIGSVDSFGRISSLEEFTFGNAPSRARRLPRAGDTIVSTVRTYLRAISYVATDDPSLVCSTGFAVVTAGKRLHPKYLAHWMRSDPMVDEICARSTGVSYPAINASEIGCLPVPMLTIERQRQVAAFLDRKTAGIDALIAKKERLIELLQEKRQALITQAVTKGLDSNVPMKESGVTWFPGIPNHWNVLRLRHACSSIFLGLTSKVDYVNEGGVPLVRALNIAGGTLDFSDARNISEEQHRYLTRYRRAQRHDVLLSKSGSIGTAAIVKTDAQFSIYESIFALRGRPGVLTPRFLLAMLRAQTTQAQYMAHLVGMGVTHLNMSDIIDVRIPVPPPSEQILIAEFVDSTSERLVKQEQLLQQSVDRIREYRQALITAAVTGKMDVSKEAA